MNPDAIDRVVSKYAKALGLDRLLRAFNALDIHRHGVRKWRSVRGRAKAVAHCDPTTPKQTIAAATTRKTRRASSRLIDSAEVRGHRRGRELSQC
jgi:hypothetical protein